MKHQIMVHTFVVLLTKIIFSPKGRGNKTSPKQAQNMGNTGRIVKYNKTGTTIHTIPGICTHNEESRPIIQSAPSTLVAITTPKRNFIRFLLNVFGVFPKTCGFNQIGHNGESTKKKKPIHNIVLIGNFSGKAGRGSFATFKFKV